jgi:hypothetical protein
MILNNEEIKSSMNHMEANLNDIYSIDEKFEIMKAEKSKIVQ